MEKFGDFVWASRPNLVPKPSADPPVRLTVDERAVNMQLESHVFPMPPIEDMVESTRGSRFFGKIDATHGYWQFSLAEESREIFTIITDRGAYRPTRILQGTLDSVEWFHGHIARDLEGRAPKEFLQWIDDVITHCQEWPKFLEQWRFLLTLARDRRLKFSPKKTTFYDSEILFCGKIYDGKGYRYQPADMETITKLRKPSKVQELHQFLHALNWIRSSIPQYATAVAPLKVVLEKAYNQVNSRKTRSLGSLTLSQFGWTKEHEERITLIQSQLALRTQLATRDYSQTLCLFTDASDVAWAAIVTQVPKVDKDVKISEWEHEPLSFLSGVFQGSAKNWHIQCKEAYAIRQAIHKRPYLFGSSPFILFCDNTTIA
jgi:hypothetical protein